jgi:branched-chain amino acid transport system substrate-binding protein
MRADASGDSPADEAWSKRKEELGVRRVHSRFTGTKVATSAAVVLGVSMLAACTSSSTTSGTSPASNSTGPITIGASLSLTPPDGAFTADGQAFYKGYELWAKDVNSHGGLLGRQVKLDILDDQSQPNLVVANYQKLFGRDHVDLAFGPFSSLLSGPASAVAASHGMAFVEGAARRRSSTPRSTRLTTTCST